MEKKLAEEAKALEVAKPTTLKIRLSLSSKNDKNKGEKEKEKPVEAAVPEKRKRAPEHLGMQPKQIFTGFYSDSNKRLKKTVFNGMLRVPPNTTELVRKAINNVESDAWAGIHSEFNLPNVHDMLRPSLDPALASNFFVTELRAGDSGTTLVTARRLVSTVGAERIRGGGDGDVPMEDVSKPVPVPLQSQPQQVQPQQVQPTHVQVQPQQVQPTQVQPQQVQPQQVPYGATPLMQQQLPPTQQLYGDIDPFGPGAVASPPLPFADPRASEKRKTSLCNNFESGLRTGMVEWSQCLPLDRSSPCGHPPLQRPACLHRVARCGPADRRAFVAWVTKRGGCGDALLLP